MLLIVLIAAFIYDAGNPLTDAPDNIRDFMKNGLVVTYVFNFILAVKAFFDAREKNLPLGGIFWFFKTFSIGSISLYEVQRASPGKK